MAKQVKTSLDLNKNEIQNVVVQKLAAAPGSPVSGLIYFDTVLNFFRYYDGTVWVNCRATPNASSIGSGTAVYKGINAGSMEFKSILSGNNILVITDDGLTITLSIDATKIDHTSLINKGSNTHAQIDTHIAATNNPHATTKSQVGLGNVTDDAQLKAADLDTDATLAANSNVKIPSQSAVKNYVDNKITGVTWKESVRAASTANIAALSGTQTIDGVALVAGNRVLVKNQTAASSNGIYVVAAGAWTRALDNDSAAEMLNATVMVQEGTVNAETQWTCSTNAPITLGTTSLAFSQMSGAGTYAAGDGLSLNGNAFAVDSTVVRTSGAQTISGKTIDADTNTISNLETDNFKAGVIDTDGTLNANSDAKLATQKAVKTYADTKLALKPNYYKGSITAASSGTITSSTHTCGTAPLVQVFEISGGNASLVEVDIVVTTATGDVTWTASTAFTGYIVIIGK